MDLSSSGSVLLIKDNIKSVEHFQNIKSALDIMGTNHKSITIKIPDSLSMTSSVIGYLMKLIHKEGINLTMEVGDERLYSLLDDLGLKDEFHVRKSF